MWIILITLNFELYESLSSSSVKSSLRINIRWVLVFTWLVLCSTWAGGRLRSNMRWTYYLSKTFPQDNFFIFSFPRFRNGQRVTVSRFRKYKWMRRQRKGLRLAMAILEIDDADSQNLPCYSFPWHIFKLIPWFIHWLMNSMCDCSFCKSTHKVCTQ